MAIIPLRAYNREIQDLIDNGQLDEAVAHCRHILATFPKHIATYRLLAKVHLEQQRISDATDIFQRVLSAIPDDFLANVGMSIIREDENNLDASIWHMELAYEAQPSNTAIQDELRRLYGRRDGTEPTKVRLTRGALARMYAKGGLFDQAAAELHAAIAEDPNRSDLQLLLAEMFFQTSQRVEAVETCANILKKLPYCLAANQILAACLPEAEQSDASKNYRQNAITMDPYFAFASPEAISSDQVPDEAITVEKLEWKSGLQMEKAPVQPDWATSLGISLEKPKEEKLPDWINGTETPPTPAQPEEKTQPSVSPFIWDTQEVQNIITDSPKSEAEIPDWMTDAGWHATSAETTQKPEEASVMPSPPAESPAENQEKADIPDWLSGMTPQGVAEGPDIPSKPKDEAIPWLDKHEPGPTDSIIHWLEDKKPELPATPAAPDAASPEVPDEEMPAWLKDLDLPFPTSIQTEKTGGGAPAFLTDIPAFIDQPAPHESAGTKEARAVPPEEKLEPDEKIEPISTEAETLQALEAAGPAEETAIPAEEIPDWLKDIAEEKPAASTAELFAEELAQELSPRKDEKTAEIEPFISEELPALETDAAQAEAASKITEEVAEEMPVIKEEIPSEEVPITPEKTASFEAAEEFELPIAEVETPQTAEIVEHEEGSAVVAEELPDWLKELAKGKPAQAEPEISEEQPAASIDASLAAALAAITEEPTVDLPVAQEEMPSVEAQTTLQVEAPLERIEEIEPVLSEAEILQAPEASEVEEAAAVPAEEIPDWLKQMAGEKPEQAEPVISEELFTSARDASLAAALAAITEEPTVELPITQEEMPSEEAQTALEVEAPLEPIEEIEPVLSEAEVPQIPEAFDVEEAAAVPAEEIPDWLKELAGEKPTQAEPVTSEELSTSAIDASLAAALAAITEEPTAELPVTQEEMPAEKARAAIDVESPLEPIEEIESVLSEAEIPQIPEVSELEEGAAVPADEIPDWLKELAAEKPVEAELKMTDELPSSTIDSTLAEALAAFTEEPPGEAPAAQEEMLSEEAPITLEIEEALEQPITTGEITEMEESAEEPISLGEISEKKPIVEEPVTIEEIPAEEIQAIAEEFKQFEQPVETEGELATEATAVPGEADAFAWLEGLAAEQGAKEEELITPSEERMENPPEWVKMEAEAQPEEVLPEQEAEAQPEGMLSEPEVEEPAVVPAVEMPEWIKGLGETPEITEALQTPAPEIEISPAEELPSWLKEMEPPEQVQEAPIQVPEALEWKDEELPEWLKEITEEETPAAVEPPSEELPVVEEQAASQPEPSSEWTLEEARAAEAGELKEEKLEELQPEGSAWVPEAEEPGQPGAVEAEAVPTAEELLTPEVEIAPVPPLEQPAVPEVEEPGQPGTVEAEPVPVAEELLTPEVEIAPVPPLEQPAVPEVEEPGQPVTAEAEPVPPSELLPAPEVEVAPAPLEQPAVPELVESDTNKAVMDDAWNSLDQGLPAQAAQIFSGLIKQNYHLEEIITDLQDALYRFPVDVNLWVSLGDAYFHKDDFQEALNAYTKAEELVR